VATGTLWSGSICAGDELRAEPVGVDVRVRSVEVHDRPVERAEAGQRVAVSLPGVDRGRLARGDALVEPGAYPVSFRLDVALEELMPIEDGTRLHVHHGTAEVFARVVRLGEHYAQLRLARPVVAARGDRVVLREGATLGGGLVLDPAPVRTLDLARLELLERGDPVSIVQATVGAPVSRARLSSRGLLRPAELEEGLVAAEHAGDWFFSRRWLDELTAQVRARLERRLASDALDPGLAPAELLPDEAWSADVVPLLGLEQRNGKLYLPGTSASLGPRAAAAARLESELAANGSTPSKVDDRELAAYLEREGKLVRVGDGFAIGAAAYEEARRKLLEEFARADRLTLARFRDALGVSRRAAQLLLERFDADGLTRRVGDERVLRRAAARG
jgi:selenocysteine-specific elongation factor